MKMGAELQSQKYALSRSSSSFCRVGVDLSYDRIFGHTKRWLDLFFGQLWRFDLSGSQEAEMWLLIANISPFKVAA